MTPGIYEGIDRADLPPGLSYSGAKDLLRSPFLYKWKREHPQPPSEAMDDGTITHALTLGTPRCWQTIDGGRGVTARKVEAVKGGLIPTTLDRLALSARMAAAVAEHPEAGPLIAKAKRREVAAIAQDPDTGIWLRCYFDALHPRYGVDLKTGREGTLEDFGRVAYNLGYHIQAATYLTVMEWLGQPLDAFLFCVIESKAPHLVGVRELDEGFISLGREQLRRALDIYARCTESGDWPGPEPYLLVSPPRWAWKDAS